MAYNAVVTSDSCLKEFDLLARYYLPSSSGARKIFNFPTICRAVPGAGHIATALYETKDPSPNLQRLRVRPKGST